MPQQNSKHLTDEELNQLRTAEPAPSPAFMAIARRDPGTVGKKRNSARELCRQVLRNNTGDLRGEDLHHELRSGGHFFNALYDGQIGEAFVRADTTNTRLLLDTFNRGFLVESLIEDEKWTAERAERYVDERIDTYGDGLIP